MIGGRPAPRQVVLAALLLITDPRRTLRARRHRHDPPAPRPDDVLPGQTELPLADHQPSLWSI